MNKEFKADHFKDMKELIYSCKEWIKYDDYDAFGRFYDMGAMEEMITLIDKLESNWKALKEWLDEQLMYFKENNEQSGFSDNVEDLEMVLDKMNSLEGDK